MQNNEVIEYAPVSDITRAREMVLTSNYMRLTTPNGVRRISRRDAWQAVCDCMRCADCIGSKSWCEACKYIDMALTVRGSNIYLDATMQAFITC